MEENLLIYEALRNELIRLQSGITNETIYMYVVYITLFAFGYRHNWLLLASFIVLIVFQAMISRDWWSMTKCSAYICTFFETPRKDMHWESFHRFEKYKQLKGKMDKELCWIIYRWSATFLATTSLIALVALEIENYQKSNGNLPLSEIIILILGFVFFHIVLLTNRRVFSKSDEDTTGLKKCTEEYLEYIHNKEKFGS